MKLWQAIATAQLTAGTMWADRYSDFAPHMIAEGAALAFGIAAWKIGEWLFGSKREC